VNTIAIVASFIVGLMLAETRLSRANERRLRARGAVAPDGDVYAILAVLYPTAFVAMALEGAWRAATATVDPVNSVPSWFASGLLLFVAAKALKYWAIRALGERWTFRVLIMQGAPLVTTGPYRYVAHPNYIGVIGELVGAAMMLGAPVTGPLAIALFGVALAARIRFEQRVMTRLREPVSRE
jgi:methyltransferase